MGPNEINRSGELNSALNFAFFNGLLKPFTGRSTVSISMVVPYTTKPLNEKETDK